MRKRQSHWLVLTYYRPYFDFSESVRANAHNLINIHESSSSLILVFFYTVLISRIRIIIIIILSVLLLGFFPSRCGLDSMIIAQVCNLKCAVLSHSTMPQMSQVLMERAIGILTAGMSTRAVARELNVYFSTIRRLKFFLYYARYRVCDVTCTTVGGNTQPRWQPNTAGDAVVTATVTALLINSMRRRCVALREANGGHTRY